MSNSKFRKNLCIDLGISEPALERLIKKAPHAYKTYTIAKKSGGRRVIAQPAKQVKYLQYWLIENIFNHLPVHSCATAYKTGSSIKTNAKAHTKNKYIAKFDFKDFFTSIKEDDIKHHLSKHFKDKLSEQDINDIARLSCIKQKEGLPLCLSIGAPSSPILSNSTLYEFDCLVSEWCKGNKIRYTRYADDLTFSTSEKELTGKIEDVLRDIVRALDYPSLRFNNKKTLHISKKHQRRITGIILDNQGNLSLGRKRKREISSLIHRYTLNQLSVDQVLYLQGLLGFAKDVEPIFIVRMNRKYGSDVVSSIFKERKIKE